MTSHDLLKTNFEDWVFTIRGVQIMIDRDISEAFGVETKAVNQAVKRNIERFPVSLDFSFRKMRNLNWSQTVTG